MDRKEKGKSVLAAIAAAFTSPEAVKAEKNLAALVVTRLVITLGGSAGTAVLIEKLIHSL